MKLVRLASIVSLSAAIANCPDCEVIPTDRLAPFIAIGDPFDVEFSACTAGIGDNAPSDKLFRDCSFNYGAVDIGRARVFQFTIENPSPVKLLVESVTFDAGSDPAFTIDGAVPASVEAGNLGQVVGIKFAPTVEGEVRATLRIKSTGENLLEDEDVIIELTATGNSRCQPDIEIAPAVCDFGDVGVGATGFCDLSIKNVGACELVVSNLGFTPETPFPLVFGPQGAIGVPLTIGGGTAQSIRLYARPTSATTFHGGLVINSFDPDEPEVIAPLVVRGAEAPTCIARVSRINNTPTTDASPAIEPLDDVELSADQSVASRQGGTIQAWQWTIIDKPPESSAVLNPTNAREAKFRFSSAAGNVNGIDVAGTFTVGLIVTDDLGAQSTQCTVVLNSVPRSGLHVQLTWDSAQHDVDLHLARNNGAWCSNDAVYYGGRTRNWDGVAGNTGPGDPSLDIDDLTGFGPENITIERPGDGRYTVGVDMYRYDGSRTTTTVKIFIGGQLEHESFHDFTARGQWLPARVEVSNGISTVVTLDDSSRQTGTCFGL